MLAAIALFGTAAFGWFGPFGHYYAIHVQHISSEYDGIRIASTMLMVVFGAALAASLDKPQSIFD